jgi:hypothetical protein
MMSLGAVRAVFAVAGAYDFVLGFAFLSFGPKLFESTGVPPPNHWGYVQFGSLFLIVFGLMFFEVARDPVANRNLMPFGMLLKLSYTGLVICYWATTDLPWLFKPFAAIDGLMFVLFVIAYRPRPSPR